MAYWISLQYFHCFLSQKLEKSQNYGSMFLRQKRKKKATSATPKPLEDALVEEIVSVHQIVGTLENEKASLTLALEK